MVNKKRFRKVIKREGFYEWFKCDNDLPVLYTPIINIVFSLILTFTFPIILIWYFFDAKKVYYEEIRIKTEK